MITKIEIKKTASYNEAGASMDELKKVNFVYGSNGAGKTTISKLIANEAAEESVPEFSDCAVSWDGGAKLKVFVYNQDFVKANFRLENEIKGIFTLGEGSIELLELIEALNKKIQDLDGKMKNLNLTLGGEDGDKGKKGELKELKEEFYEKCWEYKKKYEGDFYNALTGFMGSKKGFAEKMLQEWGHNNQTEEIRFEELKARAETIYNEQIEKLNPAQAPSFSVLLQSEEDPILEAKIVGKSDIDIAGLIIKLNNSDWVRQGRQYLDDSGNACPFCQQGLQDSFRSSLNNYFDQTYSTNIHKLDTLLDAYSNAAEAIKNELATLKEIDEKYINHGKIESLIELFHTTSNSNINILAKKKAEPSTPVELQPLKNIVQQITEIIEEANKKINEHNAIVDNIAEEKKLLISQIWRFLIHDARETVKNFESKSADLDKAIRSIEDQINELGVERNQKTAERKEKEKQGTSVKPTVDAINKMLKGCGFSGFKLQETKDEKNYKIVRLDGIDAHITLSEGEKSFIAFLYFFYSLEGSHSQAGIKDKRAVVFDDPVSSLDSETLFVIGTLIKSTFNKIADEKSPIQQVFVLTHNIYFFKEVTFNVDVKPHSFWIVRKKDNVSSIKFYKKNPVKSAYRMLWDEVNQKTSSSHTIRNTMRRILEYYFTMIGGKALNELPMSFENDEERRICQSLISWLHSGSHFPDDDDLSVSSDTTVEQQLTVFRKIFEHTKQEGHYNMMTGDKDEETEEA